MSDVRKSRIFSLFLSIVFILSVIAGRSKIVFAKESTEKGKTEGGFDANTVFEELPSPLEGLAEVKAVSDDPDAPANMVSYDFVSAANGRYYVHCAAPSDQAEKTLYSFDENGSDLRKISLPSHRENARLAALSISKKGNIFLVWDEYSEEDSGPSFKLTCLSPKGKKIWSSQIEGGEDLDVRGMVSTKGVTVLLTESDIRIYQDEDGTVKKAGLPAEDFFGSICLGKDGQVLLTDTAEDDFKVWKLDTGKGTYAKQETQIRNFHSEGNSVSGAGGFDFFCSRDKGIYGFKLGSAEPVLLVDYMASDLLVTYAGSFAMLSEESILLAGFGEDDDAMLMLLKKTDPSKVGGRAILTLGCVSADLELRKAVVEFNKSNQKFRISIQEYPYEEGPDGTAVSQLNTEIAAGRVPDMLCVNSDMPLRSYASKGLFEEVGDRFEKDPELSKIEYLTNVLNAFKIDGKMYFTVPGFTVAGLMGKKSDFQDTKGVTVSQFEELINKKSMGYDTAAGIVTGDDILSWTMNCAMDQYVDWNAGSCSFDSDSFTELLEFAARFPNYINDDDSQWEKSESWIREGKQLVKDTYLYDFNSYMQMRYGYFGQEVVLMGYPGDGKNGPVIQSGSLSIAMSHAAQDKDACWEFMRTFYLDEYQLNLNDQFPVNKKALLSKAKAAMEPEVYTYTDEKGKEVTEFVHESIFLGGKDIVIPEITQADLDEILKILEKVDRTSVEDADIDNIIREEAGAFFAGQKSARETAQVIQNRVKVYVAETK